MTIVYFITANQILLGRLHLTPLQIVGLPNFYRNIFDFVLVSAAFTRGTP